MQQAIQQLLNRITLYPVYEVVFELAIIWVGVFFIFRFLRGTRGAGMIKGLALLLIFGTVAVRVLGQGGENFQRINYLYNLCLGFATIALIVIFQPELRRALVRLGEATMFRTGRSELGPVIESIVGACGYFSKNRIGALIAIERQVGLAGYTETGVQLDAAVSSPLLRSIFWRNSTLHDLGVVIHETRIVAARVQFPLAEVGDLPDALGSRHRAAVGVTLESDCIVVVVSEETGKISIAMRGNLQRSFSVDELRRFLMEQLLSDPHDTKDQDNNPKVKGTTKAALGAKDALVVGDKILSSRLEQETAVSDA